MSNYEKKNKHLTFDDRLSIQEGLSKGMSFKSIAQSICKCPTTVSREVKIHLISHSNSFVKRDDTCPLLLRSPFVCNGCEKKSRNSCTYKRRLYVAKKAQADYEETLVEARSGIPLNKESFYQTEKIISDAVRKGQHIYHAIKSNDLAVSTATVYRHIKNGYYSISAMDLPGVVKFKERCSKRNDYVPNAVKKGRTYDDFLEYIENHPDVPITELDTVIGRRGGKVIMTIHFVNSNFMIGILLENKTAAEAADKISQLKNSLRVYGFEFGSIMPLLITDNGGEFCNVSAFENNSAGVLESHMFFCEPCSPHEKPHIEKNHTMFRDILPSGTSFDNITQEQINLIFSHINAVKRKQFNGKSSYDMFTFSYSVELATALGITLIPAKEVIQSPELIRKYFSK